ncbi:MAG: carboxypeptidase regulatory-like domain-containing protein [Candidatus Magnetomorum sp.]|nr:carboxypeptidase regulatory-like domain-containing protein [Candidatus Magnetomorum sp.]
MKKQLFLLFLLCLIVSMFTVSAYAETTITISGPSSIAVGETGDVSFIVNDIQNGSAFDFIFYFEPVNVICAAKNTDGGFISAIEASNITDCTNGKIQYANATFSGKNGTGTLFTTTFEGLTDGIATIRYHEGVFSDPSTNSLPFTPPSDFQIIVGNPPPEVYFDQSPQLVLEDANIVSIKAIISKIYDRDVSIQLTRSGSATPGADYTVFTNTISIPQGLTAHTQQVCSITNDVAVELSENIIFSISSATNATIGQPSTYTVIIDDNDLPTVSWTLESQTIKEDAGSALITATLNTVHPYADVSFNYTVTGSATSGEDYVLSNGILTIPSGALTITKTIDILDNTTVEPAENIIITLGNPQNATCGTITQTTVNIIDDDIPVITFNNASQSVSESDGSISIPVEIDKTSYTNVTLSYIISGTATPNIDYQLSASAVTIDAGNTQSNVSIDIINDTITCESSETITIIFNQISNASFGNITITTLTIKPNDPEIQWTSNNQEIIEGGTSVLSVESCVSIDEAINITYSTGGNASESDYTASHSIITIPANQQSASLTINVLDDTITCENDETLTLTLEKPDNAFEGTKPGLTITIPKNDPDVKWVTTSQSANEGDFKLIEAQLCMAMDQNIDISYSLGGTADESLDYTTGTLSIPANLTSANLSVSIINDETTCENDETITLSLNDSENVYAGSNKIYTLTILQNDPEIYFSGISQEALEGDTVTLNISSCVSIEDSISIPFVITGSAENSDYSLMNQTIIISENLTSTTLPIKIIDDTITCEPDERLIVTLGKPNNAYTGAQLTHEITIAKNDPTVKWTATSQQASEGDNLSIQAEMCMPMPQQTDINCTASGVTASTSDYSIGSLSIPANMTQANLDVSIIDDDTTCEPDETFVVTINDSSTVYAGIPKNFTITIAENDPVIQWWSSSEQEILENERIITLTATTCVVNTVDSEIPYTVSGTADSNDHSLTNGTFTLEANSSTALLTFTIYDDEVVEPDEKISVQLGKVGNIKTASPDIYNLLLKDNDLPALSWETLSQSVSEDSGTISLTVTMDKESYTTVYVNFVLSGDVESTDHDLHDGSLTILAGQTSATTQVTINNDTEDELNEVLKITLSNPVNALLGDKEYTLTIVDNDTPLVQFDLEGYTVNENVGTVAVNISMLDISYQDIIIPYTISGSAQSTDYTLTNGSATIDSGYTTTSLSVPINDDHIDESLESIIITLNKPDNANIGSKNEYTLIIEDNDVPEISWEKAEYIVDENANTVTLTVTLDIPSYTDVSVDYQINEISAHFAEDYTLNNGTIVIHSGQQSASITVLIANNEDVEPNESIQISLVNPQNGEIGETPQTTVIIRDDDMTQVEWTKATESFDEDQGTIVLEVSLNKVSYTDVTVPYALTLSGTATAEDHSITSGVFVIPAESMNLTKSFTIIEDGIDEPDETIVLELQTPTNAKLGINRIKTITIIDNDVPVISWSKTSDDENENIGSVTITAQLSIPSYTDVVCPYTVSGSADSNDHQLTNGSIVISAGLTSKTLIIVISDDDVDEPNENVVVTLGNPDNAQLEPSKNSYSLTILDNDTPLVNWSKSTLTKNENAGTITLTATLTIPSYTDVIVNYSLSGDAERQVDYQLSSDNFTISKGNLSHTFSITIVEDKIVEPHEDILLTFTQITNAMAGETTACTINIQDNDSPMVTWEKASQSVLETAGNITIMAVMDKKSYTDVYVDYTVGGSSTFGSDHNLMSGTIKISENITSTSLNVDIEETKTLCEPKESLILTLSNPKHANIGLTNVYTLWIIDICPDFNMGQSYTVLEDSGSVSVSAWTKEITSATFPQIPMQFNVSNDDNSLFQQQPEISPEGTLTFESAKNAFGMANVSVSLMSDDHISITKTFQINVISVNDAPDFTMNDLYDVNEDSGAISEVNWMKNISCGPLNESDQTFQIIVNNNKSSLFANEPQIDTNGTLSFTPAPNQNGFALVTVQLQDSGNTLNGGVQSTSKQFTLTVNPINDAPVNTAAPRISGILQKGQAMSSTKGEWNDNLDISPGTISYQYQWEQASDSDGNDLETISGANGAGLTLSENQVRKWIRLTVTAQDDGEGTPSNKTTVVSSKFSGPVLDVPFISFVKQESPAVYEQEDTFIIPIRLGRENSVKIVLPLSLSGAATNNSDYTLPESIEIPIGSTSADLTLTVLDDTQEEDLEDIIITLGTPTNAQWGSITQHTFTIKANDLRPEITDLSETSGYISGGASVGINGDNFVRGATVTFGKIPALKTVFVSKNLMNCVVPASNTAGTVDVSVTNPGGNSDTTTFTYLDTRNISGQVLSASGSTPITNCQIVIKLLNKTWYEMTDNLGNYTVSDLPLSDRFIVSAWPDFDSETCYQSQYYNNKDKDNADKVSTKDENATVNFSIEACNNGSIKGSVHDLSDTPLTDDIIWVQAYSDSLGEGKPQRVNSNGTYEIKGLKPANDYEVCATLSETAETKYCYTLPSNLSVGVVPESCSNIGSENARLVNVQNTVVSNIDIIIDSQCSGGTIEGLVRKCNGKPAANIYVFAKSAALNIIQGTFTDIFGRYTINGLIPVSSAQKEEKGYVIGIASNGYPTKYYGGTDEQNATRVATGSTDIDLSLGCYYFSGTITDASDRLVYGAIVLAWSRSEKEKVYYATSNANGDYTITNLKPLKDYVVQVVPLNYASQFYNDKTDETLADLVDISIENKTNIDFRIGCGAKLCGRIYLENKNTPASQGISVNISSKLSNTSLDVLTDSDGFYEICNLDETVTDYVISVILENHPPSFYHSQGTVYSPENAEEISTSGDCDKDIVITKGFSIKGKIQNNNVLVSRIQVEAFAIQGFGYGKDVSRRMADTSFNYEIKGLAPGTYEVSIDPQTNYLSESKTIEIVDQDVVLDFELQRPSRMIKGTVFNLGAGKTVWISAWSPSVDGKVITVTGPGDIDYTLTGLQPASDYRVKLISPHYPDQYYNQKAQWGDADKIDITTYDAFEIDFTIEVHPTISGTVIFNNGETGDTAWVVAFSPSKGTEMAMVDLNNPTYEIQVMKADDYEVSVWSDKYIASPGKQFVDTTSGNVQNINFSLDTGRYISGTVLNEDGQPVSGITVEASSLSTGSKFGTTNASGEYQINGLESVDDYIVSVFVNEKSPAFFYSTNGSVRDLAWATEISTENGSVQNIDIDLIDGERICGMVIDDSFKNIANVLIRLESEALQVQHSVKTDADGKFEFTGLPSGNDYNVFAIPPSSSSYQQQNKHKVSTKVCNLYFILTPAYTLSGIITDNNGEVCSKIEVEIIHDDFYAYYRTDSTGYYEIKGIPENKGYAVIATAAGDTAYLPFKQYNISITQSIEKNITLTPALDISGYLKDSSGNPVSGVTVKGISVSSPDSLRVTTSNTKGFYKINNIPAGSDYTIKVEPLHYGEQKKAGQTAGTTVDFVLSNGGMISGYVKNTTFSPLAGIFVQISSDFLDKSLLTVSDKNGYFVFKGLSENDPGGNLISDYLISAASIDYLSDESSGHKVGDEVNFTLTSGLNNVITGTLTDSNASQPSATDYVRVYLYKTNKSAIVSKVKIDANGQFEFNNLDSNTSYEIKFKVLKGSMVGQRRWAGENGPEILRGNAKSYSVGSDIQIQLDGSW